MRKKDREGIPPWGEWFVLDEGQDYKVKRIEVYPGRRLSYQKHSKRKELWTLIRGEGKLTIDGKEIPFKPWDRVEIPVEVPHRVENIGTEILVFIEIQSGNYLGEDDVVRLEDDYGRAD